MQIRTFGTLPTGEQIEEYTLQNAHGMEMSVLTYGGIVRTLKVPDRDGRVQDVVLGFNTLADYLAGHPCFGALIGRVAGRITGGQFSIDGTTYALECNNGPNHLHGGSRGFDKRVWHAHPWTPPGTEGVRLRYVSPAGEEGYPGNLDVTVTYLLTDANEWIIHYSGQSDRPTPFSPTNHSYFNLGGEDSGPLDTHTIQIHSDQYIPSDQNLTLASHHAPVIPGVNDLRTPRAFKDVLPNLHSNHGDHYCFANGQTDAPRPVAVLQESRSGRRMEVLTTASGMQFYTGSYLEGDLTGKGGQPYSKHAACCLECQGYPDGAAHPEIDDIVLRPGQTYRQQTIYAFSCD